MRLEPGPVLRKWRLGFALLAGAIGGAVALDRCVAQEPVIGGVATEMAAAEVEPIDSWGDFVDWIRAAGKSSEPVERGNGLTDLQPTWWVGLVPAVSECSPAESALEAALKRLSAEVPEVFVVGLRPASLPSAHPILDRLETATWLTVPDERFAAIAGSAPLPRLVIVGRSGTVLFDASIPRAMADEVELLRLLESFRRWAQRSE